MEALTGQFLPANGTLFGGSDGGSDALGAVNVAAEGNRGSL